MSLKAINAVVSNAYGGMYNVVGRYAEVLRSLNHEVINVGIGSGHTSDRYDYIIKNSGHYDLVAKLRTAKLLKESQAKFVFCHCSRSVSLFSTFKKKCLIVAVPHTLNTKRFLKADYFIAISNTVQENLLQSGVPEENITLIYNSVRLVVPKTKKFNKNSTIYFGYIGRLDANKNIEFLLKLMVRFKEKGLKAKCIIAGNGPHENYLKAMVESLDLKANVEFEGWIEKEDFYKRIDYMMFPSNSEVMPLAIIEAFACGVPVITNRFNGFGDPFNEINLFVMDNLRIDEWAKSFLKIISDDTRIESVIENAKATYDKYFSELVIRDRLKDLLQKWN